MDKHGRLLIPSVIRNALNYKYGDSFVVRVVGDELRVVGMQKEIEAARALFKKYDRASGSAVDEFLESRRQEARKESLKFGSGDE